MPDLTGTGAPPGARRQTGRSGGQPQAATGRGVGGMPARRGEGAAPPRWWGYCPARCGHAHPHWLTKGPHRV